MTWLIALYPPRWRRRYGEELGAILRSQSFSPAIAVDVIAGAIDAWLAPQNINMAAAEVAGGAEGGTMIARMMKLGCAGYGPEVTKADEWKSVAMMIGGTLVLTLPWMWLRVRTGGNSYVDAFAPMPFLIPYLASMRYTHLKGRSTATQAVFIGVSALLLVIFLAAIGWIASRL